jgi:hypothetical protein
MDFYYSYRTAQNGNGLFGKSNKKKSFHNSVKSALCIKRGKHWNWDKLKCEQKKTWMDMIQETQPYNKQTYNKHKKLVDYYNSMGMKTSTPEYKEAIKYLIKHKNKK